jgi:GDP-4-dehydro-6-deoxy-D-mannose reductase
MTSQKRCLITGINGFAGSHLTEALLAKGYAVSGIEKEGNFPNLSHLSGRLQLFLGDILDKERMLELVKQVQPDYVFHLAAQPSVALSFKEPELTHTTNVIGTQNVLDAVREQAPSARILLTCTADEYGNVSEADLPIKETHRLAPTSPYAKSKKEVEELAIRYHKKYSSEIVISRSFNHTGPRQAPEFVLSDWARQVAEIESGKQKPIIHVGNLEVRRDFLDVRDVVEAYITLVLKGAPGEVYNVCSGKARSLREYLDLLITLCPKKISVKVDSERLRPVDNPVYCGDNTKLKKLGWRQSIDIKDTLKALLEYWRKTIV